MNTAFSCSSWHSGVFGTALSLIFLWWGPYTAKVQWTLTLFLLVLWLSFAFSARERIIRPLQTIFEYARGIARRGLLNPGQARQTG